MTEIEIDRLLALEVIERVARMEVLLTQALSSAEEADEAVIEAFVTRLSQIKEVSSEWISVLRNREPGEYAVDRLACLRSLYRTFLQLDRLHLDLSLVRSKWTPIEAYTFVSGLKCGPLASRGDTYAISIVLSDAYMFEMTELSSYLGTTKPTRRDSRQRPTFYLPKIEAMNPLGWASLAHEVGHALARETFSAILESEYVKAMDTGQDDEGLFRAWTEELCCDLLACRVLGPAYLSAFVSFASVLASQLGVERSTDTHPSARLRVWMMSEFLERIAADIPVAESDVFAGLVELSGRCTIVGLASGMFEWRSRVGREIFLETPGDLPAVPVDIVEYRDRLFESVLGLDEAVANRFGVEIDKTAPMVSRIVRGVPIGSVSQYIDQEGNRRQAQHRLKEFEREVEERTRGGEALTEVGQRFRAWLEKLKDVPNGVAEIVNYGWVYRWEKMIPDLVNKFFRTEMVAGDAFTHMKIEVERLDRLLRKSIENSYLHAEFESAHVAQ